MIVSGDTFKDNLFHKVVSKRVPGKASALCLNASLFGVSLQTVIFRHLGSDSTREEVFT